MNGLPDIIKARPITLHHSALQRTLCGSTHSYEINGCTTLVWACILAAHVALPATAGNRHCCFCPDMNLVTLFVTADPALALPDKLKFSGLTVN